jgi:dephospho-CoA kinase
VLVDKDYVYHLWCFQNFYLVSLFSVDLMRIIAFVGMPASGKGEASKVALELGVPVVNMGDVIREEVRRRALEASDVTLGAVASELRRIEGADAVARRCLSKIENLDASVVVVDGVRNIEEVECFKRALGGDFMLVAIVSSFENRLERVRQRKREDAIVDASGLVARDERELGWGLGRAIEQADVVIENNRGLGEFRERVRQLLEGRV